MSGNTRTLNDELVHAMVLEGMPVAGAVKSIEEEVRNRRRMARHQAECLVQYLDAVTVEE